MKFASMAIWIILLFTVPHPIYAKDSRFECGAHGRFEYCIDGIPGCVIGCHCHPGYYFDTDTKICEPNIRLSQLGRRQYFMEPTRSPLTQIELTDATKSIPPDANASALDDHVDAVAKNVDDLGDWLYNQFYKTIESQVINKTNDSNVLTRRSNTDPLKKKVRKKKNKREKNGKKGYLNRKKNKNNLRRKLLRITEDDSIFNDSSDTDSSDSTSSRETNESSDEEHGHKKFVILNKKPKPPLPSFIFLPNIETPFYPPIGLPPPALPMFPMIPVPPVLPSLPLPNVNPNCNKTENPTSTTSSSQTTVSIITGITSNTTVISTTEPATIQSDISEGPEDKPLRVKKGKKKNLRTSEIDAMERLQRRKKYPINMKLLKKTKEDINFSDLDLPTQDESSPMQTSMKYDGRKMHINEKYPSELQDTVDFKYLTELIHRIDFNKTENPFKKIHSSSHSIETYKPQKEIERRKHLHYSTPQRRFNVPTHPESNASEDLFYSNLGRQIASLIRGVESQKDREINIEIEQMNPNTRSNPMFNELTSAPHSYWERFVRSPLDYLKQYNKNNEYLKKSNELYNIENKVENVASIMHPMNLQEIENVINVIEKSQSDIQNQPVTQSLCSLNNTLNINLWPQEIQISNDFSNYIKPVSADNTMNNFKNNYLHNSKMDIKEKNLQSNSNSMVMQKKTKFTAWFDMDNTENLNAYFNTNIKNKVPTKINNDKNKKMMMNNTIITKSQPSLSMTKPTRRNNLNFQTLSPLLKYHKKRYLNVDDQYPFYNSLLQYKFPTAEKPMNILAPKMVGPSYFHHEIHHFDYIG